MSLALRNTMSQVRVLFIGLVIGGLLGAGSVLLVAEEPSLTIRNGILKGWVVTSDNEVLICRDPMIFIRTRQIECE